MQSSTNRSACLFSVSIFLKSTATLHRLEPDLDLPAQLHEQFRIFPPTEGRLGRLPLLPALENRDALAIVLADGPEGFAPPECTLYELIPTGEGGPDQR